MEFTFLTIRQTETRQDKTRQEEFKARLSLLGRVNSKNTESGIDLNNDVAIHWILKAILEDGNKILMKPLEFTCSINLVIF